MIGMEDIGHPVEDTAGRSGILVDYMPNWENPAGMPGQRRTTAMAFVVPTDGRPEFMAPAGDVHLM